MTQITDLEQHQVYLGRLATQLLNANIYPSYAEAYKAIRLILLDAETIGSLTKLNAVNRAISQAIAEATTPAWQTVSDELTALAVYESAYYVELIGGYAGLRMKTPPKKQVEQWMGKALMALESDSGAKQVRLWADYVQRNQSDLLDKVGNIVRQGYQDGLASGELIKKTQVLLLGAERNAGETEAKFLERVGLTRQAAGKARLNADALVRTGVQFYANEGRNQMIQANSDLLAKEVPFVTFDNRTSPTCRSVDANYHQGWPVGQSPIGYPPYHFGCRTNVIPLVEGQDYPDGLRPAVGGKDTEEAEKKFTAKEQRTGKKPKYKGRRDLEIFEIDRLKTSTRYDTWLRKQPRYFVEDVLGEKRAALFIDGKMSLASFSDMSLRQLTLKELQARDRAAFVRAGLIAP